VETKKKAIFRDCWTVGENKGNPGCEQQKFRLLVKKIWVLHGEVFATSQVFRDLVRNKRKKCRKLH